MAVINHPSQISNVTIGTKISVTGWVFNTTIHKNVTFLSLRRDRIYLQCTTKDKEISKQIKEIPIESYIKIEGTITRRLERNINKNKQFGDIELLILEIKVISYSKELPVDIRSINKSSDYIRNKWKFLDLRNEHTTQTVIDLSKIVKEIRLFMYNEDFNEINTPIVTLGTPEGACDYLVISREHPGLLYALAQSPQMYKQLLVIGGIEKYFQIAPCFRNEAARKNRIPICFYQLDIEMLTEDENIIHNMIFKLIVNLVDKFGYTKNIKYKSLCYEEAIKIFNSDKVDLRVIERYQVEVSNESELIITNTNNICNTLKSTYSNIVIKGNKAYIPLDHEYYNQIMTLLSSTCNDMDYISYVLLTDFPFFKNNNEGKIVIDHNPFSDVYNIDSTTDKLSIKAKQYDIILNGQEIGSGSVRNIDKNKMIRLMRMANYSEKEITKLFGQFLQSLQYGTPPHAGIALGIERICSILQCQESVKEYAAFQYMQNGEDPLLGSPREYSDEELEKYGIKLSIK